MKLLINTIFTLLVIAFAGSSTAQGEDDRNLQAEDVFHSFYQLLLTPMSSASLICFRRMRSFGVLARPS